MAHRGAFARFKDIFITPTAPTDLKLNTNSLHKDPIYETPPIPESKLPCILITDDNNNNGKIFTTRFKFGLEIHKDSVPLQHHVFPYDLTSDSSFKDANALLQFILQNKKNLQQREFVIFVQDFDLLPHSNPDCPEGGEEFIRWLNGQQVQKLEKHKKHPKDEYYPDYFKPGEFPNFFYFAATTREPRSGLFFDFEKVVSMKKIASGMRDKISVSSGITFNAQDLPRGCSASLTFRAPTPFGTPSASSSSMRSPSPFPSLVSPITRSFSTQSLLGDEKSQEQKVSLQQGIKTIPEDDEEAAIEAHKARLPIKAEQPILKRRDRPLGNGVLAIITQLNQGTLPHTTSSLPRSDTSTSTSPPATGSSDLTSPDKPLSQSSSPPLSPSASSPSTASSNDISPQPNNGQNRSESLSPSQTFSPPRSPLPGGLFSPKEKLGLTMPDVDMDHNITVRPTSPH